MLSSMQTGVSSSMHMYLTHTHFTLKRAGCLLPKTNSIYGMAALIYQFCGTGGTHIEFLQVWSVFSPPTE